MTFDVWCIPGVNASVVVGFPNDFCLAFNARLSDPGRLSISTVGSAKLIPRKGSRLI